GRGRSPRLPPRESPHRPRRARVRLFVALNLPPPVRDALWIATAQLRDRKLPVKWVRGEGIHLTLKFLGDVADEQEPELAAARAARDARPVAFTGLEDALGRLEFAETALVSALDLMESTLQSGGAVYHVRHSERLP